MHIYLSFSSAFTYHTKKTHFYHRAWKIATRWGTNISCAQYSLIQCHLLAFLLSVSPEYTQYLSWTLCWWQSVCPRSACPWLHARTYTHTGAHLGRLGRGEVKPGRDKVMLRHLGPVSPVSRAWHQTSWPGSGEARKEGYHCLTSNNRHQTEISMNNHHCYFRGVGVSCKIMSGCLCQTTYGSLYSSLPK